METPWHLVFMALLYILAGILHFVIPAMYERIVPPWIPKKKGVVYLSGILEIVFGAALFFPDFRTWGVYGIMGLLLLFLPVHTYMLRDKTAGMGIPSWILYLRIPFQGLLIYWAFMYL
ncbi:MAG: MauE/DoxX family redox-associated membrane protein [Robiginitalea sp.]